MAEIVTVAQAFQTLTSKLELGPSELAEASRQQNVLRENLRSRLTIHRDFLSGSYARNTAIRPLHDIDLLVVLDPSVHGRLLEQRPHAALQLIQRTLQEAYPNKSLPIVQNRSVAIEFTGSGIGYDVVPVFQDSSHYRVPDQRSDTWILSNPELHKSHSTQANDLADKKAKPLVKVAKHWNAQQGKPVKSFHLELMAYEALNGFKGPYAEGLALLFERAAHLVRSPFPVPDGLSAPIAAEDPSAAARLFEDAAATVRRALGLASAGRTDEAHYLLRQVIGAQYPAQGQEPKTEPSRIQATPLVRPAVDASNTRFG